MAIKCQLEGRLKKSLEGLLVFPWSTGFHRLKLFLGRLDFGATHVCKYSDTNSDELAFLDFETFFQTCFFNFSQYGVFRLRNGEAIAYELGFSQLICFTSSDFFSSLGGSFFRRWLRFSGSGAFCYWLSFRVHRHGLLVVDISV